MKQYRAWYTEDDPLLLFEMVYIPDDELYFRMAEDHEIRYDFKVPFIDTDWIVEEGFIHEDKVIFEGDLVRIQYINHMDTDMSYTEKIIESEIVFNNHFASFGYYEDEEFQFINHRSMKISVIGNIHNKE